jgi:hypothetical protein
MKDCEEECKILAIRNQEPQKELEAVKVDDAYILPSVQYHRILLLVAYQSII